MIRFTSLLIGLSLLATASASAQERRYTLLERELEYLMEIWPGDFDNREQLQFDSDVGKRTMETGGHLRVHGQIRRVDLPAFGEHVLYVEEYKDNDPSSIFRQRLYELSADEDENAIRIKLHFFRDGAKYLGAHEDPSKLDGLTREDTAVLDGCDAFLRRDVRVLAGGMKTKTCIFGEGDERRYSDYQLRISEDGYWFRDRILSYATDETLEGMAEFTWHQLERARWFRCMIDFPYEDGGRPINTVEYVRIHDQGGTHPFTYRDGREMVFTFRNNWSYGMQRETLVIVVQEGDESGPTLVYSWGQPGSDRIGVNPGWIRLQCDLDTEKMTKFQNWLRPDS